MGEPHELPPQTTESKNILPDVVHSQHIPAVGTAAVDGTETLEIESGRNIEGENLASQDVDNISESESISEHIPSKMEYSVTESDDAAKTHESQGLLKVAGDQEKVSKHSSLNIPYSHSPFSDRASPHDQSLHSSSWPLDAHVASDIHPLSEESPVILASSDLSKEGGTNENKSEEPTSQSSEHKTTKESPREEEDVYLDSLNEEASRQSNISIGEDNSVQSSQSEKLTDKSSESEEIIKLDIRGQGVPKLPLSTAKIIFGPPPEGSTIIGPEIEQMPVFQNLLSPFLVGAGDCIKVEEVFDDVDMPYKDPSLERSPEPSNDASPVLSVDVSMEKSYSSDKMEQDVLVEEVTVDYDRKEKRQPEKLYDASIPVQPKSIPQDETMSFSTLTTDYKTICEEYHVKVLVIVQGFCCCLWLICALVLLCVLMLLLTPLACYVFTFYRAHFQVYEKVSRYFGGHL